MNALRQDITNKVVVLAKEVFQPAFRALPYRLFRVRDGSGARPDTWGRKIFGHYVFDAGQSPTVGWWSDTHPATAVTYWEYGFNVERLATEADLQALEHVRRVALD